MSKPDHPNEPGRWTRLEAVEGVALWQRERSDPFPVVQFYLVAPPRQTEVLYDETLSRARFASLTSKDANEAAETPGHTHGQDSDRRRAAS